MSKRLVLLISIGVNLFLAVAVVRLGKVKFSAPPGKVSVVTRVVTNAAPVFTPEIQPAVTNVSLYAAFHWREIESDAYPVYIANLRKVNCPEKTIRSILIPDIEGLFEKRRAEIQTPATNFWMSGRARAAFYRERFRKETALDDEETALVKQLLGVDWVRQPHRSRNFFNQFETIVVPYLMTTSLSIEKTKEFGGVLKKYQDAAQRIQSEAGNILLPDDERKLRDLRMQLKADLAHLVAAGELEEMMLRMTQMEGKNMFEALKDSPLRLSPEELRQMSGLEVALAEAHGHDMFDRLLHITRPDDGTGPDNGSDENPEPTSQERKQLEQAIKSLLGNARYALFQEATDEAFRSAKSFVEQEHLPVATSRALFEIQTAAADRAEEIRADQSLSPAERNQSLRQTRATIEAVLAAAIGVNLIEQYRENGGGWLANISKKPK